MHIIGIYILEWWLTKWLNDHGFDLTAKVGGDFMYDHNNREVWVGLATTEKANKDFMDFWHTVLDFPYDCDQFIISFFHEVGHDETWDIFSEDAWDAYQDMVEAAGGDNHKYFAIPQEQAASQWGCDYICGNPAEIEEFWRVCQKILQHIFKMNGVTEV